jgi:hypothetical protein
VDQAATSEPPLTSGPIARYQVRYLPGQQLYLRTVCPRERADAVVYNEDPMHPRQKVK